MIFVGQGRHRAEIRDFARAHGPVVTWGALDGATDHCVVGSDNVGGGMLATRHLLSLGHRNIVFMGDRSLPEIDQRFEGYAFALQGVGIDVDDAFSFPAPFDIAGARAATAPVTKFYPRFDAIFAASDMIALAAIAGLREAGIRVPEDVAVIGFDDIPAGAHVNPALTSVRQDVAAGGRLLVEKIIAAMEGHKVAPSKLPVSLIVRQSCGSAVAGNGN